MERIKRFSTAVTLGILVWGADRIESVPDSIVAGLAFVCGSCLLISLWSWLGERWPQLAAYSPAPQLFGRTSIRYEARELLTATFLKNRTLRLVDVSYGGQIDGRTFEDCQLYGPAVIEMSGVTLIDCRQEHDEELIFIELPPHQAKVVGPILCTDCVFRRCYFRGVGVIGRAEWVAEQRRGMKEARAKKGESPTRIGA